MIKFSHLFILSILIFFSLAVGVTPIEAAATIKIKPSSHYDARLRIDDGMIVWSGADDQFNKDIYLYDIATATTTQITSTTYSDMYPDIEDGKVVWVGGYDPYTGNGSWHVMLYDIATATTTQISNSDGNAAEIKDGKVVWTSFDGHDTEISLYDIATATTSQITDNSNSDAFAQISDGKVVWVSFDGHDNDIYLYDIATATTSQITDNTYHDSNPIIDDGKIVWEGFEIDDWEIFIYDIATATTTKITDNSYWDNAPNINDGKVVWYADGRIFLYNITMHSTIQIADNYGYYLNERPQIKDGMIVWGGDFEYEDIFLYDIERGTTIRLSNTRYEDKLPQIEGGRVVWQGFDPVTLWNIYLWDDALFAPNIELLTSYPNPVQLNVATTATAAFTDPDTADTHTAVWDWGDGSSSPGTVSESNGSGNVADSHTYTQAGDYTITLTVTDNHGAAGTGTALITVVNTDPVTTTFNSSADTYIRDGADNRNSGAGTFMRLQSSGDNRSLVRFDQSEMQSQIGDKQVLSAKLKVTITDNGNNWGTTGRGIDIHRLITDWTEGNGTESNRGTGSGATWECAIDSLIENQAKNCSGTTEWEMGQPNNPSVHPWAQTVTATQTITNDQSGVVEFDVTSDVANFLNSTNENYGWIIKKTNEGQNGKVSFGTKESFGTRERSSAPQLVVTYQP